MWNLLNALRRRSKNAGYSINEPLFPHQNVEKWIAKENPYQYMTEHDKKVLSSIGVSVNSVARSGNEDNATRIYDRLIRKNVLSESLIVYRGVENQDYESGLARKHSLDRNYLYYDGYIFCSLNTGSYYWNRKTRMIISLSAGSHYLFTGKYSNTAESNEIILDKGSVLRIKKETDIGDRHYIWAELVNDMQLIERNL